MLGTHDSLTGHSLKNWWVYPLILFAKTQNKTIEKQLEKGVRYFDLRFRRVGEHIYGAHGVAIFNITLEKVFKVLSEYSKDNNVKIYFRAIVEDAIVKDDLSVDELKVEVFKNITSDNLICHWIGYKSNWNDHVELISIAWGGSPTMKREEAYSKYMSFDVVEPCIFECYNYKFLIPILKRYDKRIKNAMLNFV